MEIFKYAFMQRAFIVGIMLAIIIPCIGVVVVLKRLSMIGDALSHTSLAGIAGGLLLGINPIIGAIFVSIISALSIEYIRKKMPEYAEMSIAIIMSAGIGIAGILSGFVKNSASFDSFLFGSIVAISKFEVYMIVAISMVVLLTFILLYKELFFVSMDEKAARLAGIPVNTVNFIFTILTAITVSIAARTIGALIVSSMVVVPVSIGMQIGKSYKQTVIYSIIAAIISMIAGLFISYYGEIKPGGTIVLMGIILLIIVIIFKQIFKKIFV